MASRTISRVALVEPRSPIPNTYSITVSPRLGLPTMGAILAGRGLEVDLFVEPIRRPSVRALRRYDLVGISLLTNTAERGYALARRLRDRGPAVVLGGPHVSFLPDEGLQHADLVVRGEGEETLVELVEALQGRLPLASVAGLSHRDNGVVRHNQERPFSEVALSVLPDLGLIRGLDRFTRGPLSRLRLVPLVSSSRGCPFDCRFCTVIRIAGRTPRLRPLAACLDDIRQAARWSRKDIAFADDNFTLRTEHTKDLLRGLIELGLPRRHSFATQLRVDAFRDEELLSLLRDANFELLHVGFESINPDTLSSWNKRQTVDEMSLVVERARRHRLHVNGMFVVGSDHDSEATVEATATFAIDSGMAAMQMWVLTPLPGSEIHNQLHGEHRIFSYRWRHYDCQHSVFFPKRIAPSRLQRAVRAANLRFYTPRRMFHRAPGHRITYGLNAHLMNAWTGRYAHWLERVEHDLYTAGGTLRKGPYPVAHPPPPSE